jgi:hypothetical protein
MVAPGAYRRHPIPWLRETPADRHFMDRKAIVFTRIASGLVDGQW